MLHSNTEWHVGSRSHSPVLEDNGSTSPGCVASTGQDSGRSDSSPLGSARACIHMHIPIGDQL